MILSEQEVEQSLDGLREKNLVYVFYGSTSRVPKYKHLVPKYYEMDERETAIICVLLLRGAQTLGELRERTGRIYEFSGLAEVNETLDALSKRETPLVANSNASPDKKKPVTSSLSPKKSPRRLPPQAPRQTLQVTSESKS